MNIAEKQEAIESLVELLLDFCEKEKSHGTNSDDLNQIIEEEIKKSDKYNLILKIRNSLAETKIELIRLRSEIDSIMAVVKETVTVSGITCVWNNAPKYDIKILEELSLTFPTINKARAFDPEKLNIMSMYIEQLNDARSSKWQYDILSKLTEAIPAKISDGYVTVRANRK